MEDDMEDIMREILSHFPSISFAFAYGSGVFAQRGNISSENMIDFVFVVDDSYEWHKQNLRMNPRHYSLFGALGPGALVKLQDMFGARVYYNTLVHCGGRLIKYGVISVENFQLDMRHWKWLYISGRLHKPVRIVQNLNETKIQSLLDSNLFSALNTALLCLPERFSEQDLYLAIAGLSYAGDFRMLFGEDRNKVKNIVIPSMKEFRDLYRPVISNSKVLHSHSTSGLLQQSMSHDQTYKLLKNLPLTLMSRILRFSFGRFTSEPPLEEALLNIAKERHKCSELVSRSISSIVGYSSVTQSLKGILTAGVIKTCVYSGKKFRKMFRGFFRS